MTSWRFALTFLATIVIWSGTAQADFDTGWRLSRKAISPRRWPPGDHWRRPETPGPSSILEPCTTEAEA